MLFGSAGFLWYSGMLGDLFSSNGSGNANESNNNSSLVATSQNNELTSQTNSGAIIQDSLNIESTADSETIQVAGNTAEQLEVEEGGTGSSVSDAAASGINELVLSFSETSWVDIRDVDDARLAYKSYAAGENLRVSSESNMSVFIGNAAGVSVEYNGSPFDITEYREGVYAKFEVGQ